MAVTPNFSRIETLAPGYVAASDGDKLYSYMTAGTAMEAAWLGASSGLSDAIRTMIVEHLAAHLWELGSDVGSIASERLADHSVSYFDPRSRAASSILSSTSNGRIAMELDSTGSLSEASKPVPTFAVL